MNNFHRICDTRTRGRRSVRTVWLFWWSVEQINCLTSQSERRKYETGKHKAIILKGGLLEINFLLNYFTFVVRGAHCQSRHDDRNVQFGHHLIHLIFESEENYISKWVFKFLCMVQVGPYNCIECNISASALLIWLNFKTPFQAR